MHIAIGYRWFETAAGYHIERALQALGHRVTYVGLPCASRPGYDSAVPLPDLFAAWPAPPDLYLWVDPAGRYFPPGIADLTIDHLGGGGKKQPARGQLRHLAKRA